VGRHQQRCEAAVAQIRQHAHDANLDYLVADLSSQADVRRVASEFLQKHDRLDVLLNNAGGMFEERRESVDGIEMTFALNHLAYFLLTLLLLDRLKATGPARIVNVASDAHRGRKLDFDDLQARRRYRWFGVYGRSKLANLLFTYELARRLAGTNVTVNALHPGFVVTNIFAGGGFPFWLVRRMADLIAIPVEEGARTSIYLASSPEVEGITGQYFSKRKVVRSSAASRNEETARRLWQVSEKMTGLVTPA
jgi:NAD(P)-dependent dehydrogenase (short-subunit alcohol dehydrogenase family)